MYSASRPLPNTSETNLIFSGAFARFGAWCKTLFSTVPYKETEAFDLHVIGKASFTGDRSVLIFKVTGGMQHHLDADCNYIQSRPAARNVYTVRFTPYQIEAIVNTPLFYETLALLQTDTVKARLYVCRGRVDHITLVSQSGSEIEWSNSELSN